MMEYGSDSDTDAEAAATIVVVVANAFLKFVKNAENLVKKWCFDG